MKVAFVICVFTTFASCLCDVNLVQLATNLGATTLVKYATSAGLGNILANGGPFTVFGPTNDAFARLPKDVQDLLSKNTTLLKQVLEYHVINGKVFSTDLKQDLLANTLLNGTQIRTNFYHDNKMITITGSPVILANQNASNGVIHVINRVMFPIPTADLTTTVMNDNMLSYLTIGIQRASLSAALSAKGPFTLFAPSNAAFLKLPPATLNYLLNVNKTALIDVLTYHVVSGTFYSAGLEDGMTAKTLEGNDVTIKLGSAGVSVNGARVTKADQPVTNGVFHEIDTVLIPPKYFGHR